MAKSKRKRVPKTILKLPDLEQSKSVFPPIFVFASNRGQLIIPFQNYLLMAFDSALLTIGATSPLASTGRVALLLEKRPPYPSSVGSTAL